MGKTLSEVFSNLASFYKEQVDEADEAGFADLYLTCAEAYFDSMRAGRVYAH